MSRPTDAIVTGFTKNADLCAASLAPLRALKQAGVIRNITCVTWTSPEIDAYLAPLSAMPDVELVRVAQPKALGSPFQRGTIYQVRNLEAALAQVPEEDVLILKSRPDFVADQAFLKSKIENFDRLCAFPEIAIPGVELPRSPFKAKIWVPWADANQPFFYEDAACLGLKCDVAKLVTPKIEDRVGVLATTENIYGPYAHVLRFGAIFRDTMPIFSRYVRDYRFFPNDMDYRRRLIPLLAKEPFFQHLIVAHALTLAANFHVDCGRQGQLALYPNFWNLKADWSSMASLRVNPPFDRAEAWRASTSPGAFAPAVMRLYGRLMDDDWQRALFAGPVPDIKQEVLHAVVRDAVNYRTGVLARWEESFFRSLSNFYREHWLKRAA